MATTQAQALTAGSIVTTRGAKPAYYSGHCGQPLCDFTPEDTGVFICLTPAVSGRNRDFAVVDFTKHGKEWRVGIEIRDLIRA